MAIVDTLEVGGDWSSTRSRGSRVDEQRIARIVEQVVARLATESGARARRGAQSRPGRAHRRTRGAPQRRLRRQSAARKSFEQLRDLSLARRGVIIQALRDVTRKENETISRMAVEETGLGRYDDKLAKNRLVYEKTPGIEALHPRARTG
jgi:aldehyde dehydrogenase